MAISNNRLGGRRARSGQAAVETLLVMLVACLLLFGLLQVAHGFAEREIVRHAAACAARARAVGFNGWMCTKVMRAAAIPASGKMLVPGDDEAPEDEALKSATAKLRYGALWDWAVREKPGNARAAFEEARIPDYLASENAPRDIDLSLSAVAPFIDAIDSADGCVDTSRRTVFDESASLPAPDLSPRKPMSSGNVRSRIARARL